MVYFASELQGQAVPEPQPGAAGRGTRSLNRPLPQSTPPAGSRKCSCAPGSSGSTRGWEGIAEAPSAGPGNRRPNVRGRSAWSASRGCLRTSTVHCAGGLCGPGHPGLPPCRSPSLPLLLRRVRGASGAGPVGHGPVGQLHQEGAGGLSGRDGLSAMGSGGISPSGLSDNVGKVLFFSPSRSAFSREHSLSLPSVSLPRPGWQPVWDKAGLR